MLVHNVCYDELPRKQRDRVDELRSGNDVYVSNIDEARELLDAMPEVSAPPLGRMNPEFSDPRGTYRGDLINTRDPNANYVHEPSKVLQHPQHSKYPHYNIYFPDGTKAAILIEN